MQTMKIGIKENTTVLQRFMFEIKHEPSICGDASQR